MKKEEFRAVTSYEFRKNEVDSKLSLFILDTDTVTNTVLMELLSKELENKDGRFCLAVSDFDSLQHSFPEITEDERVKLVMPDSYEFIRVLSEAGRIFTTWYLPNYFVKKEGQVVYELNSDSRLRDKSTPQVKMYNYTRMINNTDYFIRDGLYEEMYIDRQAETERLSVLLPSNHYNPNKEIEQLRELKSSIKKGGIVYGISAAAWDRCKKLEDIEPDLIKDVYPFTHSLNEIFEKASVIVSSNDNVIRVAERSGKSCVLYGSAKEKLADDTIRCFDMTEAAEEGYKLLAKRNTDDLEKFKPTGCSSSIGLGDFVPRSKDAANKRILIAADWADRNKCVYIHRLAEKFSETSEIRIDFLFPVDERWEATNAAEGPLGDLGIYCIEGLHQCSLENLPESDDAIEHLDPKIYDLSSEWKRTLGDSEYDELWLTTSTEFPLGEAYKYAPVNNTEKLNKSELAESLCKILGASDREEKRLSLEQNAELCVLDGDEFFRLSSTDDKEYYISRKTTEQPYVLVKYDAERADVIRQAIAGLDKRDASVIVTNSSKKKVADIAEKRRMIEIPMEFVPPELIGSSELFIVGGDEIERAAAEIMSVPVHTI